MQQLNWGKQTENFYDLALKYITAEPINCNDVITVRINGILPNQGGNDLLISNSIHSGMLWVSDEFVVQGKDLETIKKGIRDRSGRCFGDFYIGAKYAIEFLTKDNPTGRW